MSVPCIDAEYKGEERYTKISLAYSNDEQCSEINTALETVLKGCTLDHNCYASDISDGRKSSLSNSTTTTTAKAVRSLNS
jgi:hypothetical protein